MACHPHGSHAAFFCAEGENSDILVREQQHAAIVATAPRLREMQCVGRGRDSTPLKTTILNPILARDRCI
jgi:hypothetical protein